MVFSTKLFSGGLTNQLGSFLNGRNSLGSQSLGDPFAGGYNSVSGNKSGQRVFQYPLDLGGTPNQGHFILFYVNTQDVGKLKYDNSGQASKNLISSENIEQAAAKATRNFVNTIKNASGTATSSFMSGSSKAQQLNPRRSANKPTKIFTHTRAPTTRTDMVIALYMPAQVEVTYNSAYEDKEIGMLGKAVSNITAAEDKGSAIKSEGEGMAAEGVRNAVDTFASGTKALDFARTGKVTTDRMELIFSGVAKRSFSYNFKFLPKSMEEAKMVREIINIFKFHMLPEVEGDQGKSRVFVTPDVFDIEYHWVGKGDHNTYLNKVSTCVLENLNVKYGGGRYSAHVPDDEGDTPPVESEMSLQFKELEIITKERAKEGF